MTIFAGDKNESEKCEIILYIVVQKETFGVPGDGRTGFCWIYGAVRTKYGCTGYIIFYIIIVYMLER